MNSLTSLIALLRYLDQFSADFTAAAADMNPTDKAAAKARIAALLNDATADLAAIKIKLTGVDFPGGQTVDGGGTPPA